MNEMQIYFFQSFDLIIEKELSGNKYIKIKKKNNNYTSSVFIIVLIHFDSL